MTVIYADVYFLVNFSMDFVALYITARTLRYREKLWRLCLAASAGALYALGSLKLENLKILSVALELIVPFLLCLMAFGVYRWGEYFLTVALFWGISFLLGGVISASFFLFNRYIGGREVYVNGTPDMLYGDMPLWVFFVCALPAALLSRFCASISARRKNRRTAEVHIEDGIRKADFKALCDSGNLLTEPISGVPVLVISDKVAREILSKTLYEIFQKNDTLALTPENIRKVRIIPLSTVAGEGILLGFLPDVSSVDGREYRICLCLDRGSRNFDGCDGILPASLIR